MYDDLYPEAAQTALDAKAARPPEPKQTPRFSLWGTTAAVPKGVAAGAAQAAGSTADVLGAFGSVLGTEGSAGGMFSLPTPEEDKQQREATEKLRANGPDYMSEGGRSFRNVAKDYTPDPLTTHAAERIVFDFSRVASKAITAAATMGGIPGAVVAGAEEGFTVSDQLAQDGVDLGTRSAVGAVTAATNALSFGLPVAGKTAVQTGVLALTGGPLSFMAQNAATRKILQDADYSKLADQYDPFDPLGLALSTVIPLGFGAMAMRGARQKGAAPLEDSASPAPILTVEKPTANPVGKNGFISAPNGYEVRVGQHTAGSNVLDPEADAGAFIYEVRKGSDDANPLAMVLNKEGKLVSIIKVFGGDDKSNGTAWVPPSKSDAAEVLTLLQERAQTEIGSSERQGIDKKIKDIVVGPSESAPTAIKPIADETVDAARTSLLRESVDNSNPLPKDLAAAQPHADAHAKAIDQMASGERVNVSDVIPEPAAAKASADMAARIEPIGKEMARINLMKFMEDSKVMTPDGEPLVVYHGTTADFSAFKPGGNQSNAGDGIYLGSAEHANVYASGVRGEGANVMPVYAAIKRPLVVYEKSVNAPLEQIAKQHPDIFGGKNPYDDMTPTEATAAMKAAGYDGVIHYEGVPGGDASVYQYVAFDPKQIKSAVGNSGRFDPKSASLTDPLPAKPIAGAKESAPKQAGAPDYAQNIDLIEAQRIRAVADKMRAKNPGVAAKYDDMALAHELKAERDTRMAEGQGEKASYHEKEATRLALENPDVMVMVEGMDAPKPLSEVMAMIKKDLADDIEDSNLIQVAAECFISTGAGGT